MTSFKCASFAFTRKKQRDLEGLGLLFFYITAPSVFLQRQQCFFPLPARLTLQAAAAAAAARAEEASAQAVRRAKCWRRRPSLPQPSSRQQRGDTSVPSLRGEYPAPPIGGWRLTGPSLDAIDAKICKGRPERKAGVLVFGHNKCCFNSRRANNMYCAAGGGVIAIIGVVPVEAGIRRRFQGSSLPWKLCMAPSNALLLSEERKD